MTTVQRNGGHGPALDTLRPVGESRALVHRLQLQNAELLRLRREFERSRDAYHELFDSSPVGLAAVDDGGLVLAANAMAVRLAGGGLERVRFYRFVAPEYQEAWYRFHRAAFQAPAGRSCELVLVRPDGSQVEVLAQSQPVGVDGHVRSCLIALLDLTDRKRAENALLDRERLFRVMAEAAHDVMFRFKPGPPPRYEYLNPAMTALTGHPVDEFYSDFGLFLRLVHPGDRRAARAWFADAQRAEGITLRLRARDGSMHWIEASKWSITGATNEVEAVSGIIRDVTERRRQEEREVLRALARQLVSVQEWERQSIARELHDELGQTLTGLVFSLEALEAHLPPESRPAMDEAQGTVRDLLQQVRDLSMSLRPAMLDDLGLAPSLLWLFGRYSSQTGVRVHFRHSNLPQELAPELRLAAYRIVQEALTNVARHANASEAWVELERKGGKLVVVVKDAGRGFDPETARAALTSTGLVGMRERAAALQGDLTIDSSPGRGTEVRVELPLKPNTRGTRAVRSNRR